MPTPAPASPEPATSATNTNTTLKAASSCARKPASPADTWRYTWDAEDHLTTVTTPDGT
nr:RHS repeat domain-containing protein [Streptomyces sp. NRRL S-337]